MTAPSSFTSWRSEIPSVPLQSADLLNAEAKEEKRFPSVFILRQRGYCTDRALSFLPAYVWKTQQKRGKYLSQDRKVFSQAFRPPSALRQLIRPNFPSIFSPSAKLSLDLNSPNLSALIIGLILIITLLLQAIIHPDTGEKILMPFRMSGTVAWCGCPRGVGGGGGVGACYVVQHGGVVVHPGNCHGSTGLFRLSGERSHSAGRWLKPLSHGDRGVLSAVWRAQTRVVSVRSRDTGNLTYSDQYDVFKVIK